MEVGRFYLFATPFFWTFIGRYVKHLNFQEILVEDAGYFTQTGATFDILCKKGLQSGSKFHHCGQLIIPAQGPKFPWLAKTPWVKE